MRAKGCAHIDACRALYPVHKTKKSRKKRDNKGANANTQANRINFGYNENTMDSAYRDYKNRLERGELEAPNDEYLKELRHRPPSLKRKK